MIKANYYQKFLLIAVFLFLGCQSNLQKVDSLYKKIADKYDSKIKANPANQELKLEAANFFYKFNNYEKTIDILKDATDKSSKIIKAKAYVGLKEYTQALELFEQLGELDDNEYLYLYAYTLEKKNLFAQGVKIYEKIKGLWQTQAKERLKDMGIKIEQGSCKEIQDLLKKEEGFLKDLDKDEAVSLLVDESIEVTKQNTSISTIHVIKKILSEKGKALAEIEIGYDSTYERVELEYARTITADSHIIWAGRENTRDVTQYLNFPMYSNAKIFIVSMPTVEVGSIIEYKLKVYSAKLVNKDFFTFSYHLFEREPVALANFKLILPKDKFVDFKILNPQYNRGRDLSAKKIEDKDQVIYTWNFKDLPALVAEDRMPSLAQVNPAIIISGVANWQKVYNWWYELFKDKIELTKEIKDFLDKLIAKTSTDWDKASKIYEFCSRNIRYVGVEYGDSGYEPHKAQEIFWNRYGDCKDKAILLVAMLRAAGFKAYPVLIPTRAVYPINQDFPAINFDHAIAAIELNNKLIFMDPTSSTTTFSDLPPDDQERLSLVILDNGYKLITTPKLKNNFVNYAMDIKLNKDEDAIIQRRIMTKGFYASYYRAYSLYTHPQRILDDISQKMKVISPFSQLISYSIKNIEDMNKPPILRYKFSTKKFLNPVRNLRIVPLIEDLIIDLGYISKDKRQFPIEFDCIFKNNVKLNFFLANNLKLKYLPQDSNFSTKWFDFKTKFKEYSPKQISCLQEFNLKQRFVTVEEYQEFKAALEKMFYLLKEQIVLESK